MCVYSFNSAAYSYIKLIYRIFYFHVSYLQTPPLQYKKLVLLVLHECEIRSVVMTEEQRLKVSEKTVLRKMWTSAKLTGGKRQLHGGKL
jgi:hypothetical protein